MSDDHTPILIDSHAHLDFEQFQGELEAVLTRAREAGVHHTITVGTSLQSSLQAKELAARHEQLFATAGVHPHDAGRCRPEDWPELEALWSDPESGIVAVGESGLDYYYNFSPPEVQRDIFRRQLEGSGEHDLPIVIHVRDAYEDAFAAIKEVGLSAGGVLHCFSGGPAECERALELGLYISLSGIVTFPKADLLREAARLVPSDRIMVETDAPYLAPVPHRGQRNEPAFVVHTARRVADVRGQGINELSRAATANVVRLFGLERSIS